ncbi:hypothetical protein RKE30_10870 [Streptomyces sp. Li-HN-5-11]|uniref:hypothetical protein n=1 Tax=Streptomyces sp. Li-HN-5-11 TaxID=3075432 RepID=UPI0028AC36BB|nr:hypothetical protein [Streptomyces sp. Li-HN-5-11]WNM30874.1 hypothetical protein RKE30_10870 [Streptomyces sp. Li-HN-5-11]
MVAIIKCRDYEDEYLQFLEKLHQSRRHEWEWSFSRRRDLWSKGRHLLLIASMDTYGRFEITRVGKAVRRRGAKDQEQQVRVTHVRPLRRPLPLDELLAGLTAAQRRHLVEEGQQTKGTGEAIRALLLELRPELREAVKLIEGAIDSWDFGTSRAAQEVALQRDATLGVTRMAGIQAPQLAEWDPPAEELYDDTVPPLFLDMVDGSHRLQEPTPRPAALGDRPALEDHLVTHDTRAMLGWLSEETNHVAWREFHEHGRTLLVANANRTAAERLLGCDIIFYNVSRHSLVLVQYKKLDAERGGFYYPKGDRNLAKELVRMRSLDRYAEMQAWPGDEQRLDPSPSWIKLCHPRSVLPHTTEMIHGMYFSRRQFESLRDDARLKSEKTGAVRFGYKNVPGYLDNTLFARLVETGQIGTAGTSTDLVRQQVIRSFRGQRNLVFAALSGEEPPQAKRNAQRRGTQ